MTYLASIGFLALTALSAPSAQAAYLVTFEEVGSDVIEVGGGTIDLTDLNVFGFRQAVFTGIQPNGAFFGSGTGEVSIVGGDITGPGSYGPGGGTNPSSSDGDGIMLILADSQTPLRAPEGYISGSPLSETSTYLNATFASLGMTPGEYVWTWGSGDHADTFTINIVASPPPAVPEPSTWAMLLIGFAGLGYAAVRRKSAVRAIST
jgi:PEP-CTERM motif